MSADRARSREQLSGQYASGQFPVPQISTVNFPVQPLTSRRSSMGTDFSAESNNMAEDWKSYETTGHRRTRRGGKRRARARRSRNSQVAGEISASVGMEPPNVVDYEYADVASFLSQPGDISGQGRFTPNLAASRIGAFSAHGGDVGLTTGSNRHARELTQGQGRDPAHDFLSLDVSAKFDNELFSGRGSPLPQPSDFGMMSGAQGSLRGPDDAGKQSAWNTSSEGKPSWA